MSRIIAPHQFTILNAGTEPIVGTVALELFQLNPTLCKILVQDNGYLSIAEEDGLTFTVAPNFWEEVVIVPKEKLKPDQLLFRTVSGFMPGNAFLELRGFLTRSCKIEHQENGGLLVSQEDPWLMYVVEQGDWVKVPD